MTSVHDSATAQPSADSKHTARVARLWQTKLEPAITEIFDTGRGLDFPSYTSFYTDVYNCCTTTPAWEQASDLYSRIAPFFEAYTAKIYGDAPGDDALLVDYYDSQWDRFHQGAMVVDRLFAYLNRYFILPEYDSGHKDIVPVLNVAIAKWKMQVFEPLLPRLESAIAPLKAIQDEFASGNFTAAKLKEMRIRAA
ncbi:Ubiquitin-protein ligase [Mycena sanguinolenta]|uniref:Ubiquitin-protein ligase n=1 Tax=Mycena sanguinolenta TaxID=230812 RepID=A0A8H6ZHL3_9AGAR|nr:Ubiquitin-protein ligase [Mycena sanguinolenta]